MLLYKTLFIVVVIINLCWADESKRYCGEKLFLELEKICQGQFNARLKKIVPYVSYDISGGNLDYDFENSGFSDETIAKIRAGSIMIPKIRQTRHLTMTMNGIADECCQKSCSRAEMFSYCIG